MKKMLIKNMCDIIIKKYRTSATSKKGSCEMIKLDTGDTAIKQKVESNNKYMKIIHDKQEEYIQLTKTQPQACIDLRKEIDKMEKKLRASYGFSENEDLNRFPTFNFEEKKIDNQLD